MPIHLSKQQDLRRVRQEIVFCYLCGNSLDECSEVDADHVPPKGAFAKNDRINPLILNTCVSCNHEWSIADSLLGEIFTSFNGRKFCERNRPKLKIHRIKNASSGHAFDAVIGINMKSVVYRMLHGFHAALYHEYLPEKTPNDVSLQFPAYDITSGQILDGIHPLHAPVAEKLRLERLSHNVDSISIYRNKCQYICVWDKLDNGTTCCLFALEIYDWSKMADKTLAPNACCVGMYMPQNGRPKNCAKASGLLLPSRPLQTLNPFND